jgi:hypothetical protein
MASFAEASFVSLSMGGLLAADSSSSWTIFVVKRSIIVVGCIRGQKRALATLSYLKSRDIHSYCHCLDHIWRKFRV